MFDQEAFNRSLQALDQAHARGDVAAVSKALTSLRAALRLGFEELGAWELSWPGYVAAATALESAVRHYGAHVGELGDPAEDAAAAAMLTIARQAVLAGEIDRRLAIPDDAWKPPAIPETKRAIRAEIARALASFVGWLEAHPGRASGGREELDSETTKIRHLPTHVVIGVRRRPTGMPSRAEEVHFRLSASRGTDDPLRFTASEVKAVRGHWPGTHLGRPPAGGGDRRE